MSPQRREAARTHARSWRPPRRPPLPSPLIRRAARTHVHGGRPGAPGPHGEEVVRSLRLCARRVGEAAAEAVVPAVEADVRVRAPDGVRVLELGLHGRGGRIRGGSLRGSSISWSGGRGGAPRRRRQSRRATHRRPSPTSSPAAAGEGPLHGSTRPKVRLLCGANSPSRTAQSRGSTTAAREGGAGRQQQRRASLVHTGCLPLPLPPHRPTRLASMPLQLSRVKLRFWRTKS